MIHYAFKIAAADGGVWSKLIAWKTKGPYCHVETWIDGPIEKALCFSARVGQGCGFATLDLSDTRLWTVLPFPLTDEQESEVRGFAKAMSAAEVRYDYLGILGIGTGSGVHDDHDRFCSEVCVEEAQKCAGVWPGILRNMVNPSAMCEMVKRRGA